MPPEKSTSVGAMLQAAREQQGLSINDIAERTRIRSTLIREIESDNFFGCGDTFYARGHVRSIAVTVGLDPAVTLAEFDAAHGPSVPELVTEWLPVYDPDRAKAPPRVSGRQRTHPPARPVTPVAAATARTAPTLGKAGKPPRPAKSSPSWKSAMVAAASVVALLATASFLIGYAQGPRQPKTAAPLPTLSLSPEPAPSISPTPEPFVGVNVQIRVTTGSTYIKVTNGSGARIFEGEMQAGDVKDFSDPKQLVVRYGNSSVVKVLVNGVNKGTPTCGAVVCSETYKLDEGAG